MMFTTLTRYGLGVSVLSLFSILPLVGCGDSALKEKPKTAAPTASAAPDKAGSMAHGHKHDAAKPADEADPDVAAELAKLPPEDLALAKKQKTCPVTDAPLGSMGVPFKVSLKGRTVFLCCGGCEDDLKQNADKYLAKLDQAKAK